MLLKYIISVLRRDTMITTKCNPCAITLNSNELRIAMSFRDFGLIILNEDSSMNAVQFELL